MRGAALSLLLSTSFGVGYPAPKDAPLPDDQIFWDDQYQTVVGVRVFDDTCYRVEKAGGELMKRTRRWCAVLPLVWRNGWEPALPHWLNRDADDIRNQLHRYQLERRR